MKLNILRIDISMEIKELDQLGVDSLIHEEGIRLKPYLDSVGIPTIGVGNTYYENGKRVRMTDPAISKDRAIKLFKNTLKTYELAVYSILRDDITQNQFNACVSLCYNIGVTAFKKSSLVRLINLSPNSPKIRDKFLAWKWAGGKPILYSRRMREAKLYFTK